jgi:hypothetical protein
VAFDIGHQCRTLPAGWARPATITRQRCDAGPQRRHQIHQRETATFPQRFQWVQRCIHLLPPIFHWFGMPGRHFAHDSFARRFQSRRWAHPPHGPVCQPGAGLEGGIVPLHQIILEDSQKPCWCKGVCHRSHERQRQRAGRRERQRRAG